MRALVGAAIVAIVVGVIAVAAVDFAGKERKQVAQQTQRASTLPTLGSAAEAPSSAGRQGLPTAAISLGDSLISGEAGRWKGNSDISRGDRGGTDRAYHDGKYEPSIVYGNTVKNGCHRADSA